RDSVDKGVLDIARGVKLIIVNGSGVDKVDLNEATKRNICVANAPDSIAESVADHIIALILAHYRNIVRGDRYVREGKWTGGPPFLCHSLKGKQVGIVGMGRIGSALVRRLKPFEPKVVYWDRKTKVEVEHGLSVMWMDLDELLETSDVIAITLALTQETRGLINRERIYKLKSGTLLVNTSRGAIVDEEALIERLIKGEIYAALDVFTQEPLPSTSPLISLKEAILTPHIGGVSIEAAVQTSQYVSEIIVNYVKKNKLPKTLVNTCTP
ncbi:MAG: 2-hydroxyacid dehydrogenase, partial [Desulfurococcaceae archaeon]